MGEIEVLGKVFGKSDWRELRKKVGIVSSSLRQMLAESETALETVVTGKYAMIDFWGTPSRPDARRALALLDKVGCKHLADRPWEVLSQGERQRVLIARALMAKPALLILDEPCAGLDPVARDEFLEFVNRFATDRKSPALIFVTHHVEEIENVFTHALLLKEGKIVAEGTKKTVLTSHNLSVAFNAPLKLICRRGRYVLGIGKSRLSKRRGIF